MDCCCGEDLADQPKHCAICNKAVITPDEGDYDIVAFWSFVAHDGTILDVDDDEHVFHHECYLKHMKQFNRAGQTEKSQGAIDALFTCRKIAEDHEDGWEDKLTGELNYLKRWLANWGLDTCVLCGKLMVYIGLDGTKVEWMKCINPRCPVPGNKQRVRHDGNKH